MDRIKKTVLTEEIVRRNFDDYVDVIVPRLNRAKKRETIAKFSEIVASYLDYLALPEQEQFALDIRRDLPYFLNLLGELYSSLNEPARAFQVYSASFRILREDNRTNSFHLLEKIIDFYIKRKEFDLLADVVRYISPEIFDSEGYGSAQLLYDKLAAIDELKKSVPEELHRFRFLLGLTVPEELSRAEYIMFLLNNNMDNFAMETLYGMTEDDFQSLLADGGASLLKIVRKFELNMTDENGEPFYDIIDESPFYERLDRNLTETCSVEALEEYRAFCEAHNMKWRIPSVVKMIFDKISGARQ